MSDLKLHPVDDDPQDRSADPSEPIPFPSLRPDGADLGPEAAEDRAVRLARQIEESLDNVQRRLDGVKDQLDGAFRLPTQDDLPPSAA